MASCTRGTKRTELVDIIIENGTIVTMNANREIIHDGSIVINEGKIVEVGKTSKIGRKRGVDIILNAKGKVVLPGFINVHTHVNNILLRGGLGQDRNLFDWLENVNFPGMWSLKTDDCQLAAALYCMEALRAGITTFVDNSTWGMGGPRAAELAEPTIETYAKLGVRIVYGRMIADTFPTEMESFDRVIKRKEPEIVHIPQELLLMENLDEARKETEKLMKKYHLTENERIQIWPNPTKPSFNTDESLLMCLELAEKYNAMTMTHLAETETDMTFNKLLFGMSSVERLSSIGFLSDRLLAGHCVWVNDKDVRSLKLNDVKVAHLPLSNMYLGSGIAPIAKMLYEGVTVAIGTDDASCSDNVNMIAAMKLAALLSKVETHDASVITAEKVLEMATIDGARAIGMENQIGSLEKGKKADVIIFDMNYPNLVPLHHIPSTIVYQAYGNEIDTAIVDGRLLMEHRKIPSIYSLYGDNLFVKAQEASGKIIERSNMQKLLERGWRTIRFDQYPTRA